MEAKQNLISISRQVANSVTEIVHSAEVIKGLSSFYFILFFVLMCDLIVDLHLKKNAQELMLRYPNFTKI